MTPQTGKKMKFMPYRYGIIITFLFFSLLPQARANEVTVVFRNDSNYNGTIEKNEEHINVYEFRADTDPRHVDTDLDGMWDGWEWIHNLDPLNPLDAGADPDQDGVINSLEYNNTAAGPYLEIDNVTSSSPRDNDTDDDGLLDGEELFNYLTDPTCNDTDGDGMPDGWEAKYGLNPKDPSDAFQDLGLDFGYKGYQWGRSSSELPSLDNFSDGVANDDGSIIWDDDLHSARTLSGGFHPALPVGWCSLADFGRLWHIHLAVRVDGGHPQGRKAQRRHNCPVAHGRERRVILQRDTERWLADDTGRTELRHQCGRPFLSVMDRHRASCGPISRRLWRHRHDGGLRRFGKSRAVGCDDYGRPLAATMGARRVGVGRATPCSRDGWRGRDSFGPADWACLVGQARPCFHTSKLTYIY